VKQALIAAGFVAAAWVGIVTLIRRLYDLDLSGWWLLVTFLQPLFNNFPSLIVQGVGSLFAISWSFYLLFKSGTPGDNRFGPAPVNPANAGQPAPAGSHA